jgi:hypothetical protein
VISPLTPALSPLRGEGELSAVEGYVLRPNPVHGQYACENQKRAFHESLLLVVSDKETGIGRPEGAWDFG